MAYEMAILGGVELVKFLIVMALQEARRSKMTPEQIELAFAVAKEEFLKNDPGQIPDV